MERADDTAASTPDAKGLPDAGPSADGLESHGDSATTSAAPGGPGSAPPTPAANIHMRCLIVTQDASIIIGKGGSRLKTIGSESRQGIERLLGTKVYLDLHVKVAKDWQRDPKQLGRLGFDFNS